MSIIDSKAKQAENPLHVLYRDLVDIKVVDQAKVRQNILPKLRVKLTRRNGFIHYDYFTMEQIKELTSFVKNNK